MVYDLLTDRDIGSLSPKLNKHLSAVNNFCRMNGLWVDNYSTFKSKNNQKFVSVFTRFTEPEVKIPATVKIRKPSTKFYPELGSELGRFLTGKNPIRPICVAFRGKTPILIFSDDGVFGSASDIKVALRELALRKSSESDVALIPGVYGGKVSYFQGRSDVGYLANVAPLVISSAGAVISRVIDKTWDFQKYPSLVYWFPSELEELLS